MEKILKKILIHKKKEIIEKKKKISIFSLKKKITNTLSSNFKESITKNKINLIAEIKKKSPSAGILKKNIDPIFYAKSYQKYGAAAISVLVDKKFFGGNCKYIKDVVKNVSLPILYKEFVIDSYQIYEAKILKCSAILLIAKILSLKKLQKFVDLSYKLGLEPLVEVHNEQDLDKSLKTNACIIGINNRCLDTFKTDLNTTVNLIKKIPKDKIVVSESGIKGKKDVDLLKKIGVKAILVGEYLMTGNIKKRVQELIL